MVLVRNAEVVPIILEQVDCTDTSIVMSTVDNWAKVYADELQGAILVAFILVSESYIIEKVLAIVTRFISDLDFKICSCSNQPEVISGNTYYPIDSDMALYHSVCYGMRMRRLMNKPKYL